MSVGNFIPCVGFTLRQEGALNTLPGDSGSTTNLGISQTSYPNVNIAALTVYDAMDIYERDFWAKINGDALPTGLDLAAFDFAVNSGAETAAERLQGLVGVKQDGNIGPVTIRAITSKGTVSALVTMLTYSREDLIRSLGSSYQAALLTRVQRVQTMALAMAQVG